MIRTLGVVVALLAGESLACSCARVVSVFPLSESSVPTNVVFQLTQNVGTLPTFQLFTGDQGVALEQTAHLGTNWVTVKPLVELMPGAKYVLRSEDGAFTANFFVGGGRDESAPAARGLMKTSRTFVASKSTCGDSESLHFELSEPLEEQTALLVFTGETTSSKSLQAEASTFSQGAFLANSSCDTNFPLQTTPNLAVGVRVIDIAGNVSELSEVKQAKSGGCTAAPALLGILGALTMLVRRRPPQH